MKESENATQASGGLFFSERTIDYGMNPSHFGDMEQPDGHARITGPCGDTVDMYLRIRDGKIEAAKFITDGCMFSIAACDAAARLASGQTLDRRLCLDQRAVIDHLNGLPEDHAHCALLAVTTLQKAVSDYVSKGEEPAALSKPPKDRSPIRDRRAEISRRKMKDRASL
jgi:nitrogen fixation NifU-like protein